MTASDSSGGKWRELRPFRPSLLIGAVSLIGALSLLGASPAAASELTWSGPAGCASRDALSFELERVLGVPLERAGRLRFEVRAERSESMASARLEVGSLDASEHTRAKQRLLVAEDCATLVETLAVAIGLAIGTAEVQRPDSAENFGAPAASSAGTALDPSATPAPERPAPVERDAEGEPAGVASSKDFARLRPSVFLALVGDGGALPELALGATLGAGLHAGRAAVRVSGTLLLDQRVRLVALESGGAAEVGLGFGTLQGCLDGAGAPGRWAAPLCVGVDVGQLWGRGVDVAQARREASWWVAPRFDVGLFWSLPGTTLRAGGWLTASAPLRRDEFVVDEVGVVHRPGPVVGRAALGIDASLE